MSELDKLKRIDGNEANLRRLIEQMSTDQSIVPFVGAGLSIPIGFPGWSTFLLNQASRVGVKARVQQRIKSGEFEEAAEDLLNVMRPRAFNDAIEDAFGDHNIAGKRLTGAVSYLPFLVRGPVITTNFDRVLEHVFENADRRFERIILGAKPDYFHHALHQNRPYLLKIHGDFEDASDRILTLSDYRRHYGIKNGLEVDFSLVLPSLLKRVLLGRTFLLIGCSLTIDRTVSILGHMASEAPEVAHYAIVEMPREKSQLHEKARQLADRGIRPIWFPSRRYDCIATLLDFLRTEVSSDSRFSSSKRIRSAELASPSIKKTFSLRLSFDHLIERHIQIFAGRQEPLKEISEFVSNQGSGYVFVTGQSGFGKTSLLAKLVKENPQFNYHFISQAYKTHGSHFDPTEMDSLLLNLCEQLESTSRSENNESPWARFHQFLRKSPTTSNPRVIVIDAIDEIDRHPNFLFGLLPTNLPRGVVVILSARKLGDRDYLTEVGLRLSDIGKMIHLEGLDQAGISELLKSTGGKATELSSSTSFVERLHKISDGDPFYLRFLVEDIRQGRITSDSIARIPSGLYEYFDIQLAILDRSINLPQQRDILGFILDAYGPLSRTDLISLVDGLDGLNFDNVMRDIRRFLLVHNDLYTFCHSRFKEYFSARCRAPE